MSGTNRSCGGVGWSAWVGGRAEPTCRASSPRRRERCWSSRSLRLRPGRSHPDAPAPPTVTGGNGQIVVTYVAPANNGNPITSYSRDVHVHQRRRDRDRHVHDPRRQCRTDHRHRPHQRQTPIPAPSPRPTATVPARPRRRPASLVVGLPDPTRRRRPSRAATRRSSSHTSHPPTTAARSRATTRRAHPRTAARPGPARSRHPTAACRRSPSPASRTATPTPVRSPRRTAPDESRVVGTSASAIPVGPPAQPAQPTATASNGQIVVTYVAPANNGSQITSYTATCTTTTTGGTAGDRHVHDPRRQRFADHRHRPHQRRPLHLHRHGHQRLRSQSGVTRVPPATPTRVSPHRRPNRPSPPATPRSSSPMSHPRTTAARSRATPRPAPPPRPAAPRDRPRSRPPTAAFRRSPSPASPTATPTPAPSPPPTASVPARRRRRPRPRPRQRVSPHRRPNRPSPPATPRSSSPMSHPRTTAARSRATPRPAPPPRPAAPRGRPRSRPPTAAFRRSPSPASPTATPTRAPSPPPTPSAPAPRRRRPRSATPTAGVPAPPTQPTVTATNAQIVVTYVAPANNGSQITSYTATCTTTTTGGLAGDRVVRHTERQCFADHRHRPHQRRPLHVHRHRHQQRRHRSRVAAVRGRHPHTGSPRSTHPADRRGWQHAACRHLCRTREQRQPGHELYRDVHHHHVRWPLRDRRVRDPGRQCFADHRVAPHQRRPLHVHRHRHQQRRHRPSVADVRADRGRRPQPARAADRRRLQHPDRGHVCRTREQRQPDHELHRDVHHRQRWRGRDGHVTTPDGSVVPITVPALTNSDTYTCTVTATNVVGTSPASPASRGRDADGRPAGTTRATDRCARQRAELVVTYVAPLNNGSQITSYTATCTSSNGGAAGTATFTTPDGSVAPITVTGLTNGDTYTCTVTATNAVGAGPPSPASAPIVVGVPEQPAQPTVVAATAQIVVTYRRTRRCNGSRISVTRRPARRPTVESPVPSRSSARTLHRSRSPN